MPSSLTTWRGVQLDQRTADACAEAAAIALTVSAGATMDPTQGSYSTAVSASSGTHTGAGAIDLSVIPLSRTQEAVIIAAMRRVGFAAWVRPYIAGLWPRHIHAVMLPANLSSARDVLDGIYGTYNAAAVNGLSRPALAQVVEYLDGLDGLAGDGLDPHPRPTPIPTWETYQEGDNLTMSDITTILTKLDQIAGKIGYDTAVDLRTQQSQLIDEAVSKVTQARVNELLNTLPDEVAKLRTMVEELVTQLGQPAEARQ